MNGKYTLEQVSEVLDDLTDLFSRYDGFHEEPNWLILCDDTLANSDNFSDKVSTILHSLVLLHNQLLKVYLEHVVNLAESGDVELKDCVIQASKVKSTLKKLDKLFKI